MKIAEEKIKEIIMEEIDAELDNVNESKELRQWRQAIMTSLRKMASDIGKLRIRIDRMEKQ